MLGRMVGDVGASKFTRALPSVAQLKPAIVGSVILALAVGAWYAGQVAVLDYTASAAITTSVSNARSPLRPDAPISISITGAGVELQGAQLFRSVAGGAEQAIDTRLQPSDQAGTWQLVSAESQPLLTTDGSYRLAVFVASPRPALPTPRTDLVERQYRFATVPSPRAKVPTDVARPRWGEPVSFTWSAPMQSFTAAVQPSVPLKTWIDSTDPTRAWIQLGNAGGDGLSPDTTYTVQVTDGRSSDGLSLRQPVSFQVATPPRPTFLDVPSDPVTLQYGQTFTLTSSVDLAAAQASITGDAPANVTVRGDQLSVDLPDYRQGVSFDLNVTSATSTLGAPLTQPVSVHFETPPAMDAPSADPDDGSTAVQPSVHPTLTFAQPVADQEAATRALQIDPPVAGRWAWNSPRQVEFVPDAQLPILSTVTIRVNGGPDGPRTEAGGYLDDDVAAAFRTTDNKLIDVSLSRQTMALYENGNLVRTIPVATGVAAAPTPPGRYTVQYKMPVARFVGVNPDGSHYDIPDVHWVMPFWGDYTIHGAYWRPRFGVPGSDGCISMSDPDAQTVFNWADVGTPVNIHT